MSLSRLESGENPQRPPLRHPDTHNSTSSVPYANYAFWIGHDPAFAIFRRFASLNALNLLALQAEISHEEHELKKLQLEEGLAENHNFVQLMEAEHGSNEWQQWQQIRKVRSLLKEYNALLLENRRLLQLAKPDASDRKELMKLLADHNAKHGSWLEHPENIFEEVDGESQHNDLITLHHRSGNTDKFTCWVFDKALPWIHQRIHKKSPDGPYEYDDDKIDKVIGAIAIAGASILPTASIFALNYIPRTVYRLAFISIFSFVFTVALEFFTNARKIEIFTAAVALASVQVVFISIQAC